MTMTSAPTALPTDTSSTATERRDDAGTPLAMPIRVVRSRLASFVRSVAYDRQPMETVSEQVLAGIHDVHCVHR